MRISIFGVGYVGAVSSACLASLGHQVVAVDVAADKVAMVNAGRSPIVEEAIDGLIADAVAAGRLRATTDVAEAIAQTEVSFISVGTPSAADGSVSMVAVQAVLVAIGRALATKPIDGAGGGHSIVMRSTVPPGTAEDLAIPVLERESGHRAGVGFRYYSNPEFLREGSSVRDFHAPPFTLVGAAEGDDAAVVREIYQAIDAPVHVAPYRVSESTKYLSNVYHAVKLAFANEAGAILAAHGVDAREAFRLFREDRVLNISPAYLRPGFAFGGSCLPKDIRSFLSLAAARDVAAPFLRQVLPGNVATIERAFEMVTALGRQPAALFGLAFKPGTDDLRESPFVALAERLIGRGYDLRIHDRHVQTARLTGSNRAFIEREIPHLERLLAADPNEALADATLAIIGHVGPEDRPALFAALTNKTAAGKTVIDLAGIPELASLPGVTYRGFCW